MSSFINDEEIKKSLMSEIIPFNKCIEEYYKEKLFEDDLKDFQPCCNEDEINLLIRCYKIFSENKHSQSLDIDFIRALLAYYYMLIVFENYIHDLAGNKYLKIVDEIDIPRKLNDGRIQENKAFRDNKDNDYVYYWTEYHYKDNYIEVQDPYTRERYYLSNKDRETNPYVYSDFKLKNKIKISDHMNCLEIILKTKKSKDYYQLFYSSEETWVSEIRRIILNMNPEEFKGGKRRNMKKTKRTLKKNKRILKKSRKNKKNIKTRRRI